MPIDWELQHSFLLAMALNYHSRDFVEGSYALDSPPMHEVIQHPWGNMFALMNLFSNSMMPLHAYGATLTRKERVQVIVDYDPKLISNISVCWIDSSTGANCGRCSKCQRARAMFKQAGVSTDGLFKEPTGPTASRKLPILNDYNVRMTLVVYADGAASLPKDDPQRDILDAHVQKLRRAYVRQLPYR
jgi:hypothetical protein